MNIENILAFVLVNHFGSINKASKALFLSQPSVTSRIKSLERDLDTKLFDRNGKQIMVTDEGRAFLPYAETIIQSYKKGKEILKKKASENEFVIGCTGLVSNYLIPEVIPIFNESYPNVQIKLITASSDIILQKVLNGEVDIGLARSLSHPLAESQRVFESPIRLLVQPNHRFASLEEMDLEELATEPLVFFECGSLDWSMVHNLFKNLRQLPNIQYEVDNMQAAKELIMNRAGIGFLPEICVRRELKEGKLVAIDLPILSNLSLKTNSIYYKSKKPIYFDDFFRIAQQEGEKIYDYAYRKLL
ncbi:LysR family transcriptional regulator [Oceanobacillus rekensis]|uniref:LysR family transcriptional regulator n=1 Tax=Oceanobacillus rekensis TaxID=937927 RepID=UPI000B43D433|nr:LysR family transcriptional regulator [Oceanobacillus rekensis]